MHRHPVSRVSRQNSCESEKESILQRTEILRHVLPEGSAASSSAHLIFTNVLTVKRHPSAITVDSLSPVRQRSPESNNTMDSTFATSAALFNNYHRFLGHDDGETTEPSYSSSRGAYGTLDLVAGLVVTLVLVAVLWYITIGNKGQRCCPRQVADVADDDNCTVASCDDDDEKDESATELSAGTDLEAGEGQDQTTTIVLMTKNSL
jgi:hypothetical protein